jgi:hypothetical protein
MYPEEFHDGNKGPESSQPPNQSKDEILNRVRLGLAERLVFREVL